MKNKKIVGSLLAASIALSATFSGCSLVTSNSAVDMEQVIATVNISSAEGLSAADSDIFNSYKTAVGTTQIMKRELVAYFLNAGADYMNNYNASYSQVFTMLVDGLVENAVLTQYAVMYLLDKKAESSSKETVLSEYTSKATYTEKLEYLLHDPSEEYGHPDDPDLDVKVAKYNLYSTINNAIDSQEKAIIDEDEQTSGEGSRTTPGGVDSEQEDYYPKAEGKTAEGFADGDLYYNVYTGYNGYLLKDSGIYKDEDVIEGSTRSTRIKAYNQFMQILDQNGLVDIETDDLRDLIHGVAYMDIEYATQLENRVINKYYDIYEEEQESKLTDGGAYEYLQAVYDDLKDDQQENNKTASAFKTAIDNMSDTSFVLYSPDTQGEGTYGYVYNILLPFDSVQSAMLAKYQADHADSKNGGYTLKYYQLRNQLLDAIRSSDQRTPWFNGATEYSFKAEEGGFAPAATDGEKSYYAGLNNDRNWLFFQNNLTKTYRYEPLEKYIGKYAFNGTVYQKEDESYLVYPNKLSIDDMLAEFSGYVNYVLGSAGSVSFDNGYTAGVRNAGYYTSLTEDNFYVDKSAKKPEIDYGNFIYASGKVNFAEEIDAQSYKQNLLNKESAQYKALAAVNELQYAYTTDTGVLSNYLGYTVTLGDTTGYIKEFEYAAHEAIKQGTGAFTVCAGDYGWHLIYVTYTFGQDTDGDNSSNGGNEYSEQPNWAENVKKEGTFENLFYEWVKANDIAEISTTRRTQLINQFKKDETVTKYQSRYQDLLDLN